jgi:hypothetical protein
MKGWKREVAPTCYNSAVGQSDDSSFCVGIRPYLYVSVERQNDDSSSVVALPVYLGSTQKCLLGFRRSPRAVLAGNSRSLRAVTAQVRGMFAEVSRIGVAISGLAAEYLRRRPGARAAAT